VEALGDTEASTGALVEPLTMAAAGAGQLPMASAMHTVATHSICSQESPLTPLHNSHWSLTWFADLVELHLLLECRSALDYGRATRRWGVLYGAGAGAKRTTMQDCAQRHTLPAHFLLTNVATSASLATNHSFRINVLQPSDAVWNQKILF